MPPLSLLIKPASSSCNLRCKYCFYHSLAEKRSTESFGLMSSDTLELLVKKALKYAEYSCTFAFQGGEPTIIGPDFFKKLIEYEKTYNTGKIQINNAIQTNGMLINDEWAEFFSANNFLVGISLDGPKDIHDANRFDARNKGSFSRVMNAVDLFNKHKVEYNILTVVNSYTARHISKIYTFFKKNGFKYLQFIPCLDPFDENPGNNDFSLTPARYTYFLNTLFDLWHEDINKGEMISIRYFDNLVGMAMGYPPESCGMSGQCVCYYVIEANGGVYPCDFYVIDRWYLGNIKDDGFEELRQKDAALEFINVSKHADPKCLECKWANFCRGGCRRNREPFIDGKPVLNYYCSAYEKFYEHAGSRIVELARRFSSNSRG